MPAGLPEGKIAAGFRQVMRAIAQGKAARIYVAQNAQESIRAQAIAAAEAAGHPVFSLPCQEKDGFLPRPEAVTQPGLIVLCTPNNPTGAAMDLP